MNMPKKGQIFFTKNELKERVFAIGEHEHKVFMPNEIFEELKGYFNDDGKYVEGFFDVNGNKIKEFTSSTHIAYAYAYVYLAHYMYRYCKYHYYEDSYTEKVIDEKMIKQVLGFPAKSDQYTYITKKGGVLDKLGYIRKKSDVPTAVVLQDEFSSGIWRIAHIVMESDYPELYGNTKNRKINYPVKAFFRAPWAEEDCYENGTYFEVENTHLIDIDVFLYCMADAELGVKGFYMYSFLKYMTDKHAYRFDCSIDNLVYLTGLGVKTIRTQLINLEKRNMISNDHKPFCFDKKEGQITKANTYKVISFNKFASAKIYFKEIPKQRRISAKAYEKEIGFVSYQNESKDVSFSDTIYENEVKGQLPF